MTIPAEPASARAPLNHRAILAIAVPIMISNLSTPLLGVVDTGVIGQIPDASLIGAVLVAAQWPIRELAFFLLEGSERVENLARDYFDIRIWAAPATLANYALLGWFIGLGKARVALALQLILNVSNMLLDAYLVLVLDMGVKGVAIGTVIAEFLAAFAGIVIALRHLREIGGHWDPARLLIPERVRRTLMVNRDIMIRSLSLIFVFAFFMAQGAKFGDNVLAANAVLMHFISVSAYFLDGFAFAAESFVGRAVGAAHRAGFSKAARMTTWWAAGVALLSTSFLIAFGSSLVDILTVEPNVRAIAREFLPWAALAPLVGVWRFQLDGIFIGATRTADMRNAMLVAALIFLVAWYALTPFGNHGLWAALYVHYAARSLTMLYYFTGLQRSVPA